MNQVLVTQILTSRNHQIIHIQDHLGHLQIHRVHLGHLVEIEVRVEVQQVEVDLAQIVNTKQ